jgi:glutathione synthase
LYVLKTQREGGGHNYFGDDIREKLSTEKDLWKYSLMERIFPISFPAMLMRNSEIWTGEAVSEIGVFGRIIGKFEKDDIQVLDNQEIGWMMRTKPIYTDEGGVNAGYAYVDCPYLADDDELEKTIKHKFTTD